MQDTLDSLYEELAHLDELAFELSSEYLKIDNQRAAIKREIKEAESLGSLWG